jgi:RNA polymerase sigma-70 factor (ECF subfamily)
LTFVKNISQQTAHQPDDKELVAQYKASGSMQVLGNLYQRYMDLVYGVCLKYLKDSEKAKDSVMQIFEELVPKLKNMKWTILKDGCTW